MLAEHRLEVGGPVGEARRGLPEDRDQALGSVAHALGADPRLVQLRIGRARPELAADPLEVAPGSFHQRPHRLPRMRGDDVGEDGRLARGRDDPVHQREVPRLAHRRHQVRAGRLAFGADPIEELRGALGVVIRERLEPPAQSSPQHVEITHLPQLCAEPPQLLAQIGCPLRIEEAAERAEVGTDPAGRHPSLVHGLGVLPQPHTRVEADHALGRTRDGAPHHVEHCAPATHVRGHHLRGFRRQGQQRAHELRDLAPRFGAAGRQPSRQSVEHLVLRVRHELDLDLPEPPCHAASVEHRHLVVHHLGDVTVAPASTRSDPGGRSGAARRAAGSTCARRRARDPRPPLGDDPGRRRRSARRGRTARPPPRSGA